MDEDRIDAALAKVISLVVDEEQLSALFEMADANASTGDTTDSATLTPHDNRPSLEVVAAACVDCANAHLASARRSEATLRQAVAWAHIAQRLHRSAAALFAEARALDALGCHDSGRHLGRALSLYRTVAGTEGSPDAAKAARILQEGVSEPFQPLDSLPARFRAALSALCKPKELATALEKKGDTPIGALKSMGVKTASGLSSGIATPVKDARSQFKDGRAKPSPVRLARLELFADIVAEEAPPPQPLFSSVLAHAMRRKSGKSMTCLSWNAKCMHVTDNIDTNVDFAVNSKTASIARMARDRGAALVVVQEAPGPQLRSENSGKNARKLAKNCAFTSRLAAALGSGFKAADVAVHQVVEGKGDMGEDHVFAWDDVQLRLLDAPRELDVAVVDESGPFRFHRKPSVAQFEHRCEGGGVLTVVSVHLKSGGGDETVAQVRLLGRAVKQLVDARARAAECGAPRSILIVGDFNLAPDAVHRELEAVGLCDFANLFPGEVPPITNLPRFCGNGSRIEDGHSYDGALLWTAAETGSCGGPSAAVGHVEQYAALDVAYDDMRRLADCFCQAMRDGYSPQSDVGRGAMAELLETAKCDDGVPRWLRKTFQKHVYQQWSDHKAISVELIVSSGGSKDTRCVSFDEKLRPAVDDTS